MCLFVVVVLVSSPLPSRDPARPHLTASQLRDRVEVLQDCLAPARAWPGCQATSGQQTPYWIMPTKEDEGESEPSAWRQGLSPALQRLLHWGWIH